MPIADTVWHEILAGVYFCGLAIFLCFATDWFLLLGINFRDFQKVLSTQHWFLAKRRAARFIISSRAKRACITQASQGQRDFLLAINLSSLVGVRLDVIQSSDVKAHYGFWGNLLPSTTKLWDLFCLVPARRLSRPSRSMHFGDVSETNGRETPRQSRSAHAWAFLKSSHGQLK